MCLPYELAHLAWAAVEHGQFTGESGSDRSNSPCTTDIKASKEGSGHCRVDGVHLLHAQPFKSARCCHNKLFFHNLLFSSMHWWIRSTTLTTFNPEQHVKPSNISVRRDWNNLEVTVFHLPKMKCAPEGEDVFWSHQEGIMNPDALLENHLWVNSKHHNGFWPLTKRTFMDRINTVAASLGKDDLKGYGIRIGGVFAACSSFWCHEVFGAVVKWCVHSVPSSTCNHHCALHSGSSNPRRIHALHHATY